MPDSPHPPVPTNLPAELSELRGRLAEAEARLAAHGTSDSRIQTLFDSMTEGFALHEILCDQAGVPIDYRFLEMNPAFERLTGLCREDVLGRLKSEVLPGDTENWIPIYGKVALTGEPIRFQNYSIALNQTYDVYAYSPVHGQFAVLFLNITEQRRVEQSLRDSQEHFRLVWEAAQDAMALSDPDGCVIDANPAYLKLYGYAAEQVINQDFAIIYPEEARATARQRYREVFHQPEPTGAYMARIRRADGQERTVESRIAFLTRGDERIAMLSSIRDITELQAATDQVQQSNRQLADILASIQDGFFGLDRDWRFTYLNHRAADALGYLPEDLIGKNVWDLFPQLVGTPMWDFYQEAMRSSQPAHAEMPGRIDVSRWYDISVYPTSDGINVYWLDITERKNAELERQRYAQQLEERNEELRDFAYMASHDLQEPLRKVRSLGDIVLRQYAANLSPEGQDYLRRMIDAGRRMQSMIDGLLSYSRVNTQGQSFESVPLQQAVAETLTDLDFRIAQTRAQVEVGHLPTIQADPVQIRQLLGNLFSNALKYAPAGEPPYLKIWADTDEQGDFRLHVQDHGIGFDPRHADQIFQPFVRLHSRTEYEGVGMGLAICRKIVLRHGGTIRAVSQPAQGTELIITLPKTLLLESG
jgi:PAS domain S-box-containing protein